MQSYKRAHGSDIKPIDSLTYTGDTITAIDLRFEQHCEGAGAALHGAIHWVL